VKVPVQKIACCVLGVHWANFNLNPICHRTEAYD